MEWDLELGGAQAAALAMAIISGALLVLVFIYALSRSRRGMNPSTVPSEELLAAMLRLQGDLPELLRSVDRKLDVKMQVLRELLRQSAETIEELRRLRGAGGLPRPTLSGFQPAATAADPVGLPAPGNPQPRHATTQSFPAQRPPERTTPDPAELRAQRYAHVYSLADDGLDAAEISAETGMHRGEVELVLSLRRKRLRMDHARHPEPDPHARFPEEATV